MAKPRVVPDCWMALLKAPVWLKAVQVETGIRLVVALDTLAMEKEVVITSPCAPAAAPPSEHSSRSQAGRKAQTRKLRAVCRRQRRTDLPTAQPLYTPFLVKKAMPMIWGMAPFCWVPIGLKAPVGVAHGPHAVAGAATVPVAWFAEEHTYW